MEDSALTGEGRGWRCGQRVGSVGCVKHQSPTLFHLFNWRCELFVLRKWFTGEFPWKPESNCRTILGTGVCS